jgi:hypothetical protein
MSAEQESGALSAERQQARERAIERQIMQRTWGRIQALEVKVSHDLVIVRGRAPSYYVEQLALQGVIDLIESAGTMRIELNIQVASPRNGPERPRVVRRRRRWRDAAIRPPFTRPVSLYAGLSFARGGLIDEWYLDDDKPFRHLAFDLTAWLSQPAVVIAPVLFHPWLEAIGTIRNSMRRNGTE